MSVGYSGHFSRYQYYSNVERGNCRVEQKNRKNIPHIKATKTASICFPKKTNQHKTTLFNYQRITPSSTIESVAKINSCDLVSKQSTLSDVIEAITSGNQIFLEKIIDNFLIKINETITENANETLLWYALKQKNYRAAALLIQKGAELDQPQPATLGFEIKKKFREDFFANPYYYGKTGEDFFKSTIASDYENTIVYAIASHFYLEDSVALDFLLAYPKFINRNVLKIFIRSCDLEAFQKSLILYLQLSKASNDEAGELLKYALGDYHFSLMGFNFDYIVQRLEIIKLILTFNPVIGTLNDYNMTCFEIAQYLQDYLPVQASQDFEKIFSQIFEDPTGFHEIWGIQRLLINSFGDVLALSDRKTVIELASYPSVNKYFKKSINEFFKKADFPNEVVFVTPSKEFTFDSCLKMIAEKKILKFFTGWTDGNNLGHAINAVIYDKYLLICNRGYGSTEKTSGICIYEIQEKNVIEEIIQLFLSRSLATHDFIEHALVKHPHLNFLKQIPGVTQRVGNCVWLSEKMGICASVIASFLKKGQSLEESTTLAIAMYKQWSGFDRLNLIKAYVEHPYHTRNTTMDEADGIEFKKMIGIILNKTPKRLLPKCFELIFNRLTHPLVKISLGQGYAQLITYIRFRQIEFLLEEDHLSLVLTLLEHFPDVNLKVNITEETLLHLACRHNNLEFVQQLIKRGAKPSVVNAFADSPLDKSLSRSKINQSLIQFMIDITDLNQLISLESFPFHTALRYGNEYAVQAMLKKGYNLNTVQKDGKTAFHFAAISPSENLSKMILEQASNIEVKTKEEVTPLALATKHNVLHGVKILLDQGANPNNKSLENIAPINLITRDSQLEVCKLLLARGADINHIPDNTEYSQLMCLVKNGMPVLSEYILQNTKVDIDVRTNSGETALTLAVAVGMVNVTRLLLNKGKNPNARLNNGETLLHIAVKNKQRNICSLLLELGADKTLTYMGKTPFEMADCSGDEVMRELLMFNPGAIPG